MPNWDHEDLKQPQNKLVEPVRESKVPGESAIVCICYTNWRGETKMRRILPKRLWFGKMPPYHRDEQWLLDATDLDKQQPRTFALKDVRSWFPTPTSTAE